MASWERWESSKVARWGRWEGSEVARWEILGFFKAIFLFCGISVIFFQCCFMSKTQVLMTVSDFSMPACSFVH